MNFRTGRVLFEAYHVNFKIEHVGNAESAARCEYIIHHWLLEPREDVQQIVHICYHNHYSKHDLDMWQEYESHVVVKQISRVTAFVRRSGNYVVEQSCEM